MDKLYWKLFFTFLKIGAFTFGGGWAMISLIEREVVDKNKWIDREEFLDLLAISQSMPGILAVNISVSIGDKLRGFRGSLTAALGTILPFVSHNIGHRHIPDPDIIKNNPIVSRIFMGIRPCVVALIVAPVITSARAAKNIMAHCVDSHRGCRAHLHRLEPNSVHRLGWTGRLSVVYASPSHVA